jgi:hypothetical protein
MPEFDIVQRWSGRVMLDPERDRIGTIVEIYYDAETDQPGWALCNTADIGADMRLVPLGQAVEDGGRVRVPFSRAGLAGAPGMEPGGRLWPHEEAELYAYYGLAYTGASVAELAEPEEADDEIVPLEDAVGAARWRRRVGR